jgi:hypothetical protein
MRRLLLSARLWFAITGVLAFLAIFIVDGAAGGVIATITVVTLLFACFRGLKGEKVDDGTASVGFFGNYF